MNTNHLRISARIDALERRRDAAGRRAAAAGMRSPPRWSSYHYWTAVEDRASREIGRLYSLLYR